MTDSEPAASKSLVVTQKPKIKIHVMTVVDPFPYYNATQNDCDVIVRPIPFASTVEISLIDKYCRKIAESTAEYSYEKTIHGNYCMLVKTGKDGQWNIEDPTNDDETGVLSFALIHSTDKDRRHKIVLIDSTLLTDSQAEIAIEENYERKDLMFVFKEMGRFEVHTSFVLDQKVKRISPFESEVLVLVKTESSEYSAHFGTPSQGGDENELFRMRKRQYHTALMGGPIIPRNQKVNSIIVEHCPDSGTS